MLKVLVANRGEIAIRILRSAGELGWKTVAIYIEGDTSHATFADEAVKLNDVSDFLNVERIVDIATRAQCTHLHPGYGFLSESPSLAVALSESRSSIIFIGPSLETLRVSSDKILSRNLATSLGISVTPGVSVFSGDDVRTFAHAEGYPVMIKALDGGGGRGIRVVKSEEAIEEAFERCLGESPSKRVFVEKALIAQPWKHIEVQMIGDGSGAVNHLWERECSVQRRFQKVIEIAPSRLPRAAVEPLLKSSAKMARHLRYQGLGTFEYLVNSQSHEWIFLEINPRVQVEHTVTEEITGIDLVRTQLLLSTPSTTLGSLSLLASLPLPNGCAAQLRLTAEDPLRSFRLSPGTIKLADITWPAGRGVRVDTWLTSGPFSEDVYSEWTVGTDFDSLLAKVVVQAGTFEEMAQKARRAIRELKIRGQVTTNVALLAGVLEHPDWSTGNISTMWLERNVDSVLRLGKVALTFRRLAESSPKDKEQIQTNSDVAATAGNTLLFQPGALFHLTLSPTGTTDSPHESTKHTVTLSSIAHNSFPNKLSGILQTTLSSTPLAFSISQSSSAAVSSLAFELADPNESSHVASPFAGKIVELHPVLLATTNGSEERGRLIKKGETIIVLSVMKMESAVVAPNDGLVERVGKGIRVGVIIGEGMLVCVLECRNDYTSKL